MTDAVKDPPCISGTLACSLRDVVKDLLDARAVASAMLRLPADVRTAYETAQPIGWVPLEVMEQTFEALANELGTSVAELHERVARRSIDLTMRTFWRLFLRVTTDGALVSRAPSIYARSYNRGRLESRITTPGRGETRLLDWPQAPEWPLRGTRIGIEVSLGIAGRRNVQATCTRTPTGALFIVTWR
jgi:hypothetical protein